MRHLTYLAILAACLIGTLPLEFVLHTRVYARWRQLVATLIPVVIVFGLWDLWAIHTDTWWYDARYVLDITVAGAPAAGGTGLLPRHPRVLDPCPRSCPRPQAGLEGAVNYTLTASIAVVLAVAFDCVAMRTTLIKRKAFWTAYAIVLFFQLIVNGLLTGLKIVQYNSERILGWRVAYAPLEDLLFGFALVLVTLSLWVWLGRASSSTSELSEHPADR